MPELARPGKKVDRQLTRGQWKTLFRSFMNPKMGRPVTAVPRSEANWIDLGYRLDDYEKNVGPGEYDHMKYLDYLMKNKDWVNDKTLQMAIPRIEY